MKMTVHEQLCFSTTKIETHNKGIPYGVSGTGFFFSFEKNNIVKMLLVTNKHIMKNYNTLQIHLTKADIHGEPIIGQHYDLTINGDLSTIVYNHPNDDVDLCVVDITNQLLELEKQGENIFIRSFKTKDIPTNEQIRDINPITEVKMIGYPDSIWDKVNNMPLFRRCMTASRIDLDWNGKKEFLIDGACFNGSSGSPVLLYEDNMHFSRLDNSLKLGESRFFLLGIQFATHLHNISGEVITDVQGQESIIENLRIKSSIPNNIGYVIKSQRILDIIEMMPI